MGFSGNVIRLETCDSTNAELVRRGAEGAGAWTVLVSDEQTAGRGRLDRDWFSPGGGQNLYLSVMIRPSVPTERVAAYSLVTAVALAESVAATLGGERVQVKWPNDLLIDGRKVAGVLTELHVAPGGAEWVIIGVGINVNIPADGFPPELPNATSLCAASGEQWDREALLQAFLDNLSERVDSFSRSGGVLDVDGWSQWANVGATVRIVENDRERVATVLGLTESGALRVRDEEGRSHEIIAGDVVPLSWED